MRDFGGSMSERRHPVGVFNFVVVATAMLAIEALIMLFLSALPPMPAFPEAMLDAMLLGFLILPVLYAFVLRPLNRKVAELETAREQLEANRDLDRHANKMGLLRELGGLLLTSITEEEAAGLIGNYLAGLFPDASGTLYLFNNSRDAMETFADWGEDDPPRLPSFSPDDCWAIRRGQLHISGKAGPQPACAHCASAPEAEHLCLPMIAAGDVVGLLHVVLASGDVSYDQDFVVAVAESIALGLANLKLRAVLSMQAVRDPLTGLFNRRHMEESFTRELSRAARNDEPVAVMMLDLDGFKTLNDTCGHLVGDRYLREFAGLLKFAIREEDMACRYGGDEFALILPETARETALARAEEILAGAKRISMPDDVSIPPVSVSIGLAMFPADGTDAVRLLETADGALYEAKVSRDAVRVG